MGSKYFLKILGLVVVLALLTVFVYPDANLHIIGCDVGQGDAFLVIKGRDQILVDGGPNNEVLDCLARHMPFWDREIELVVLTHPQKDHYQGLIEVFRRYQVQTFVATPLESGNEGYQVLKNAVGGGGTEVVNPYTGVKMRLGLMYLDIIYPSQEIAQGRSPGVLGAFTSSEDPNNFSVVFNLSYEDFDALFTGDIGGKALQDVLATGKVRDIEFLKVPHHGSKNGLSEDLLRAVSPEIAMIGVGKNSYGHPHQEILEMLESFGTKILRTDKEDVSVETNGVSWWTN